MKIFFSDLDGTLLNDQKIITPATKAALDAFVERGHCFVVSTGRPLYSARFLRNALHLRYPGSYLSCYNGAMLYSNDQEEVLWQTGVELDLLPGILALAEEFRIHVHTFQGDFVVSPRNTEAFAYYTNFTHLPGLVCRDILQIVKDPPCKLLAIELHDTGRLHAFADALREVFAGRLASAFSAPAHLEIYSPATDKGKTLLRLAEQLSVPVTQTLAAGDAENDIPMLQAAGCGIALYNAANAVKNAADCVTECDNNHDGLVPFLENA